MGTAATLKRFVWEPSVLHVTDLFARNVEALSSSNACAKNVTDAMTATMTLDEMSDNVSNAEQIMEMASVSQPTSSRALPDSANPVDGARKTRPTKAWPPLDIPRNSLEHWPNSNNRLVDEQSTTSERIQHAGANTSPTSVSLKPGASPDPLDSRATAISSNKNPFLNKFVLLITPTTSPSRQRDKQETTGGTIPLKFMFRTPTAVISGTCSDQPERAGSTPDSRTNNGNASDSPITKNMKASNFGQSMAKLTQVQLRLLQKTMSTLRVIMREMDEMR